MLFVSAGCDLEIMEITWCKKMSFFFFNTSVTWDYQSLERTRLERPQLGSSNHRLGIITGLGLHLLTKGKVSLQGLHSRRPQLLWQSLVSLLGSTVWPLSLDKKLVCMHRQSDSQKWSFFPSRNAEGREHFWEQASIFFFLSDTDAGKILLSSLCLCQCYLKQSCNNAAEKKENSCLHWIPEKLCLCFIKTCATEASLGCCFLCELCPRKAGEWVGTEGGSLQFRWCNSSRLIKLNQIVSGNISWFFLFLYQLVSPSNDICVLSLPNYEDLRQHKKDIQKGSKPTSSIFAACFS